MTSRDELKELIKEHNRRLQKLKEQQARKGIDTEPHILTEIEDIEANLEKLQAELQELQEVDEVVESSYGPVVTPTNISPKTRDIQNNLIIQKTRSIHLTPEVKKVLEAMFDGYSRIAIETEFGSGLSDSRVFRVYPFKVDGKAELPTVIKIAPIPSIRKELEAYLNLVKNTLPYTMHLEPSPILPMASELGGLRYELAGSGIFGMQSLREYYDRRQTNADDLRWVLQERLFEIMYKSWWQDHQIERAFQMRADYDSLLPVNLSIIVTESLTKGEACLIEASDLQSPESKLTVGDYIHLRGFFVIEKDRAKRQLKLNMFPLWEGLLRDSYRLQLEQVPNIDDYQVGDEIVSIYGVVTETRQDLLIRRAKEALGETIDLSQEPLALPDGSNLPNPLLAYQGRLDNFLPVNLSTVHGDLNLENILVDPKTRDIRLIDFATVCAGRHALHDLLRLETEVVTKLIPKALTEANLPSTTIYSFYRQLHGATFQSVQPATAKSSHPALKKSYAMLVAIREMARKCLYDSDNWAEYYQSLTLYLLGALKFKNLDEMPEAPLPKQVAFWGAATMVEMSKNPVTLGYKGQLSEDASTIEVPTEKPTNQQNRERNSQQNIHGIINFITEGGTVNIGEININQTEE